MCYRDQNSNLKSHIRTLRWIVAVQFLLTIALWHGWERAKTDEGHIITTNPLLAPYVIKIVKMWRKFGAWFWIATQNLEDFPAASCKMLAMLE